MKVTGRLIFESEKSDELIGLIAESLAPDNLSEIRTAVKDGKAIVTFSADKVGTILSSVDDYLMNAKIASDVLGSKK